MPERVLDRVPIEFQLRPDSQRVRKELLDADPALDSNKELFEEVYGLILYNNQTALEYNSPRHVQIRKMNKEQAKAKKRKVKCVDGRCTDRQQDDCPTHTEPGGFTKRASRYYRRARNESGELYIPRSPYLRGGIQAAAMEEGDLLEIVEGHYMEEPPKDETGKHIDPYEPCGKVSDMLNDPKEKFINHDLIKGHIEKLNEITIPPITAWYNDCRDTQGREVLERVCLPIMLDTVTRGYVLDLDQRDNRAPLSVSELVRTHRGRIEAALGKLVGGYRSKAEWFTDPEKITDLALHRYEVTRGLMHDETLRPFQDDILTYLSTHYPELTADQRTGVLSEFADNAGLLYLQGSAYGEAEHVFKWHNERCIVLSPEGNPPFVQFPDVQSFIATPPEPERTIIYANAMIKLWKHYREEAKQRDPNTRMPEEILMFLNTPLFGEANGANYNYIAALNASGDLFHSMVSDKSMGELYRNGDLRSFSLLYDYQTRFIRAVVNNRALANR